MKFVKILGIAMARIPPDYAGAIGLPSASE
jgi:hypothetical protein